jgi:hypothetical protein
MHGGVVFSDLLTAYARLRPNPVGGSFVHLATFGDTTLDKSRTPFPKFACQRSKHAVYSQLLRDIPDWTRGPPASEALTQHWRMRVRTVLRA